MVLKVKALTEGLESFKPEIMFEVTPESLLWDDWRKIQNVVELSLIVLGLRLEAPRQR